MKSAPFLSVIIPIYKQEITVQQNILQILHTLESTPYHFEIIPVVDGTSLDNSLKKIKELKDKRIRAIGYEENRGKGSAVRFGMKHSKGELITFIDGGMDIDPQGIIMLLEHLKWYEADIIIGSKLHPASLVNYPKVRRLATYLYYLFVKILFGLKVRDTQTGLKIYKRKVLIQILPRLLVKRYAFDIEILAVANHLGFTKIFDAPVKVNLDWSSSSLRLWGNNSVFHILLDTLAIWYRLHIKKYYDSDYLKNRMYDKTLNMFINRP